MVDGPATAADPLEQASPDELGEVAERRPLRYAHLRTVVARSDGSPFACELQELTMAIAEPRGTEIRGDRG